MWKRVEGKWRISFSPKPGSLEKLKNWAVRPIYYYGDESLALSNIRFLPKITGTRTGISTKDVGVVAHILSKFIPGFNVSVDLDEMTIEFNEGNVTGEITFKRDLEGIAPVILITGAKDAHFYNHAHKCDDVPTDIGEMYGELMVEFFNHIRKSDANRRKKEKASE